MEESATVEIEGLKRALAEKDQALKDQVSKTEEALKAHQDATISMRVELSEEAQLINKELQSERTYFLSPAFGFNPIHRHLRQITFVEQALTKASRLHAWIACKALSRSLMTLHPLVAQSTRC
jgi:vacuolar-type H+-ATPase subunit I/STV1